MQNSTIGIDLGFGDLKYYTVKNGDDPPKEIIGKFPTAIALARRGGIRGLDDSHRRYRYLDNEYLIGTDALSSDKAMTIRDLDLLIDYAPLLVSRVFERLITRNQLALNGDTALAVGLPLGEFFSKKQKLITLLSDFEVSKRRRQISDIKVFAQGQGVFYDCLIKNDGRVNKAWWGKNLVVLDFGFNTLDILCVKDGACCKESSCMIYGAGICRITRDLGDELKLSGYDLSEPALKVTLVEKKVRQFGKTEKIGAIIDELTKEYAQYIFNEVYARVGDNIKNAEKIIIAGGGAYYVKNYFEEKYGKKFIYVSKQPEFSNARGFYKFRTAK